MKAIILLIIFGLFALEAIYEGLYDTKRKELSKFIQSFQIALWAFHGFFFYKIGIYNYLPNLLWIAGSYIALRFSWFFVIYNFTADKPFFFFGTTHWLDRFMKTVHPSLIALWMLVATLAGIFWIINEVII
jgi:hypothetical protein